MRIVRPLVSLSLLRRVLSARVMGPAGPRCSRHVGVLGRLLAAVEFAATAMAPHSQLAAAHTDNQTRPTEASYVVHRDASQENDSQEDRDVYLGGPTACDVKEVEFPEGMQCVACGGVASPYARAAAVFVPARA